MMYKRNCLVCNKFFETNYPLKKTCSAKCSASYKNYLSREYYRKRHPEWHTKRYTARELELIEANNEIYYCTKGTCHHV